eukprot:1273838-Pyramimonas_sp.AAC.1
MPWRQQPFAKRRPSSPISLPSEYCFFVAPPNASGLSLELLPHARNSPGALRPPRAAPPLLRPP